jgi:hypothetical protein
MSTGGLIHLSEKALTHEVLVRTAVSWHPIPTVLNHNFFLESSVATQLRGVFSLRPDCTGASLNPRHLRCVANANGSRRGSSQRLIGKLCGVRCVETTHLRPGCDATGLLFARGCSTPWLRSAA